MNTVKSIWYSFESQINLFGLQALKIDYSLSVKVCICFIFRIHVIKKKRGGS